jgi:hypothetical protein
MYALIVLLMVHNPGNVERPLELKFVVEAHRTEASCENALPAKIASAPPEWKIGGIRSACVRLGAETHGS